MLDLHKTSLDAMIILDMSKVENKFERDWIVFASFVDFTLIANRNLKA